MRICFPFKPVLASALVIGTLGILAAKTSTTTQNGSTPVVFEVVPSNPAANSQVTITVELDGITPTGQVVTIGATDPQAFVDLPTEIVVPAGESTYSFHANTSSVYTGWTVLAATSNGGTALAIQHQ